MNNITTRHQKDRVNFLVPRELLKKAEQIAKEHDCSLSDLFRQALSHIIQQSEQERKAKAIADGCKFYYKLDQEIASDWEASETKV